jgi:hypothetical protein
MGLTKKCRTCGKNKSLSEFYKTKDLKPIVDLADENGVYLRCKECHKDKAREYRKKFRKHVNEYGRKYYAEHAGARKNYYYKKGKFIAKRRREKIRKEAFNVVAKGKAIECAKHKEWNCCVDPTNMDYLSLDHINGKGYKQRKKIGNTKIYYWAIRHPEEAKKELQILCMNAQFIKRTKNEEWTKKEWPMDKS